MFTETSPELFIAAYRHGIFPMAEDANDAHYDFYAPHMRALLPILDLHIPKSLMKAVKKDTFQIKINTAFEAVISACGESNKNRESTWINAPIKETFLQLHQMGYAHSIESWQGDKLVGGLYGVALGRVFCGESMFSRVNNASKVALVHLCARLHLGGFELLDSQFSNPHLIQFALYEIPQEEYAKMIQTKMDKAADFLLKEKTQKEILENYLSTRARKERFTRN